MRALEPRERDSERVHALWDRLAVESQNIFATREWVTTWLRHFGDGGRLHVLCGGEDDGEPPAIVPLHVHRAGGLRVARLAGHGPTDQGPLVCAPEHAAAVARALAGAVRGGRAGCDLLLAERLRHGDAEALGGRAIERDLSPELDISRIGWEDYVGSLSKSLRAEVRRSFRRLEAEGMSWRLASDPERLPADMRSLFELHGERWGERASGALAGRRMAFHSEFAALALERGWLRLWLGEAGGSTVVAWYGFRFGGAEWFYQAGRSPDWHRFSVGTVATAHSIRMAMKDGVPRYRFLRGDEPYKRRFNAQPVEIETRALGATLRGRATAAGVSALLRHGGRPGRRLVRGAVT